MGYEADPESILLGRETVPKDSEVLNLTTEDGKKEQAIKDKNELAFEELILSVDGSTREGRVAFQLIKGCKTSDHEDGDAALAWKRLKNKFAATTAPSLVKLKKRVQ